MMEITVMLFTGKQIIKRSWELGSFSFCCPYMSSASPLEKERKQASFDVRSMTYLLEGGEEKCKRREKVRKYVEEDPVFRNGWFCDLC